MFKCDRIISYGLSEIVDEIVDIIFPFSKVSEKKRVLWTNFPESDFIAVTNRINGAFSSPSFLQTKPHYFPQAPQPLRRYRSLFHFLSLFSMFSSCGFLSEWVNVFAFVGKRRPSLFPCRCSLSSSQEESSEQAKESLQCEGRRALIGSFLSTGMSFEFGEDCFGIVESVLNPWNVIRLRKVNLGLVVIEILLESGAKPDFWTSLALLSIKL